MSNDFNDFTNRFWANEKCLKYKDNPICGKCGRGAWIGAVPQIGNRLKSTTSHFPQIGRAEKAFKINNSTNTHLAICGSCSSHKSHISGGIPRRGYPEMRVGEPVLFVETRSTRASGSRGRMHRVFVVRTFRRWARACVFGNSGLRSVRSRHAALRSSAALPPRRLMTLGPDAWHEQQDFAGRPWKTQMTS